VAVTGFPIGEDSNGAAAAEIAVLVPSLRSLDYENTIIDVWAQDSSSHFRVLFPTGGANPTRRAPRVKPIEIVALFSAQRKLETARDLHPLQSHLRRGRTTYPILRTRLRYSPGTFWLGGCARLPPASKDRTTTPPSCLTGKFQHCNGMLMSKGQTTRIQF
jgi:hypothetical protein